MADFVMKQGDLEPSLFATIVDSPGVPAPLATASTIQLRFATATLVELWVRDVDVDDADAGEVSYTWQDGDTDTPGTYYAEFVVDWSGSRLQTYPPRGYLVIVIAPKL